MSNESEVEIPTDFFQEPQGYYKPEPEPTFESYQRLPSNIKPGEPSQINVRLVGKSPLWGHLLWNAGIVTTEYLDSHRKLITGKTVLELGAGAALPSLVCALTAKRTVITDYPDPDLIANIQNNVDRLKRQCKENNLPISDIDISGYIWGNDTAELIELNGGKYDLIILSDLIFNHTEHRKLIKSCKELVKPEGKIFVVFTPHRPKLYNEDMEFFRLAQDLAQLKSTKVVEERYQPMFEEDEETKELRSMVFGYLIESASCME